MSSHLYYYRVPRSFQLRQELDFAEKGAKGRGLDPDRDFISYGLGDVSNTGFDKPKTYLNQLSNWNCSIIGPQNTNIGDRIYTIEIICGPDYPNAAPTVSFKTRINMASVGNTSSNSPGRVNLQVLGYVWDKRNSDMYQILKALRQGMKAASKKKQPQYNSTY